MKRAGVLPNYLITNIYRNQLFCFGTSCYWNRVKFILRQYFWNQNQKKQKLGNNFCRGMKGAKLNIIKTVKAVYL